MRNFKELKIWERSYQLTLVGYKILSEVSNDEKYGITSQLKRALISIPSNIAEGASRSTDKDFLRFLDIALGSAFEAETQFMLLKDLNLVKSDISSLLVEINEIQKMISSFIRNLKAKTNSSTTLTPNS
jgi:four helix bundle protein